MLLYRTFWIYQIKKTINTQNINKMIKLILGFKNRTFLQLVHAIKALKSRYKGMIVSYRSKQIGCGLMNGYIQVLYPWFQAYRGLFLGIWVYPVPRTVPIGEKPAAIDLLNTLDRLHICYRGTTLQLISWQFTYLETLVNLLTTNLYWEIYCRG